MQASLNNPAGFPAISASKQPCGVGCTSTRPRSSVLIWAGAWAMSRRAAPKVCDELAVMIRCAGQHRRYFVHCPGVHVEPVARLFLEQKGGKVIDVSTSITLRRPVQQDGMSVQGAAKLDKY